MSLIVTFYGQLTDVINGDQLVLEDITSTTGLLKKIYGEFPALEGKKFLIAVNNKIVNGEAAIPADAKISLLPPFSGG